MDYTVHGILQARTLEWVAIPSPGDLPNLGIELRSPALQEDSLPTELPQHSPKCEQYGPWPVIRDFVRNVESQAPDLLNPTLHLDELPRCCEYTCKSEKYLFS